MKRLLAYVVVAATLFIGYQAAFGQEREGSSGKPHVPKVAFPNPSPYVKEDCRGRTTNCVTQRDKMFVLYDYDGQKFGSPIYPCKNKNGKGNGRQYPCVWDADPNGARTKEPRYRLYLWSVEDTERVESGK